MGDLGNPGRPGKQTGAGSSVVNWGATPGAAPASPWPGDNPYCVGCVTSPARLQGVPAGQSLAPSIGYGAVDAASVALAARVLRGEAPLAERPAEDAFFAADGAVRDAIHSQ